MLYKILADDGKCVYGGSGFWPLPEEEEAVPYLDCPDICYGVRGYHLSSFEMLPYWIDPRYTLFEAEAIDVVDVIGGVSVCRSGKLLRRINGLDPLFYWNLLNTYIGMVSKVVLPPEDHIEVNNYLLKVDDEMGDGLKPWMRFPEVALSTRMKEIMSKYMHDEYSIAYMSECLYGLAMSHPYKVIMGAANAALGYKVGFNEAESSEPYKQMLRYLEKVVNK